MAMQLMQTGLLFRELPLSKEDLEMASRPPREPADDEEKTLEELESEMDDLSNPLTVASTGELGRRRALAHAIALKKQTADLKDKSELSTEHVENVFTADDMDHLRSN